LGFREQTTIVTVRSGARERNSGGELELSTAVSYIALVDLLLLLLRYPREPQLSSVERNLAVRDGVRKQNGGGK
jgi:hypothetical protein